jgi:hypothetical protein
MTELHLDRTGRWLRLTSRCATVRRSWRRLPRVPGSQLSVQKDRFKIKLRNAGSAGLRCDPAALVVAVGKRRGAVYKVLKQVGEI